MWSCWWPPAAGKSEVIDFLTRLDDATRLQEYRLGPFEVLDDFVYVWQTFENDAIRAHMGLPAGTRTKPSTSSMTASGISTSSASTWTSASSWHAVPTI